MALIEKALLYPQETIHRLRPKNLNVQEDYLFSHEYECSVLDCFSYVYSNVMVNSRGHAIHDTNLIPQIIPQCITEEVISKKFILKTFFENMRGKAHTTIQQAILFTDTNSHGYFHWMIDALPKLICAQNLLASDVVILLPEKYNSAFVNDSLEMLGIKKDRVFHIKKHTKVMVEKLWIMGHPAQPAGTGNYRPQQLQAFQKYIYAQDNISQEKKNHFLEEYGTKIYISRKDARYRYLTNEEEIAPLLHTFGFRTVCASEFTCKEQFILFSQAHMLLSLHGAGLSNMIWMSPRTTVAEIRQHGDAHNNCYFSLASALNIDYYYSLAQTDKEDAHTANFYWDIKQAQNLMEQLHA